MNPPRVSRSTLAKAVAEAVIAVPGVVEMSPGGKVEVATQFAGGKVVGVRLSPAAVTVHMVVDQAPVPMVAAACGEAAHRVLLALGDHRRVDVVVDDIVLDGGEGTDQP